MPNILPFRQVSDYNVLNLYSFSGAIPTLKGTFVYVISGWDADQNLSELSDVGAHYNRVVSLRYGVKAQVASVYQTGVTPLGLMLNDIREFDENGNKLIFNPRKQAEMQAVLSGQVVPVATRGMFLYSGISGSTAAGGLIYGDGSGGIATSGLPGDTYGKFLGPKDSRGFALIWVEL